MTTWTAQKWIQSIAVAGLGIASFCLNSPGYHPNSIIVVHGGSEAFALAESIVNHHSFSDPFKALPTGPSAHMAPLYPAYVAFIIAAFGRAAVAVGVLQTSVTLMFVLQLMLLPFLAKHFGLGFCTGFVAALAWMAAGTPPTLVSEATPAGLLVILAAFLMRSAFTQKMSVKALLASGLVWGALLLLQPAMILVLLAWLLLLHLRSPSSTAQKMALVVVPIIIASPWIVRNFLLFHKPVFVRDNLGIELAVSNNPCATYLAEINMNDGCYSRSHPNLSGEEALKVRQLGEVEYNQVKLREAVHWIRDNPSSFAALSRQRFVAFWLPPFCSDPATGVLLRPWVLDLFTLASIAGVFVMWRNARLSSYVTGIWLLCFPLIYYLIQSMVRYRYPILWATFVPGSYFLTQLAQGLWDGLRTN